MDPFEGYDKPKTSKAATPTDSPASTPSRSRRRVKSLPHPSKTRVSFILLICICIPCIHIIARSHTSTTRETKSVKRDNDLHSALAVRHSRPHRRIPVPPNTHPPRLFLTAQQRLFQIIHLLPLASSCSYPATRLFTATGVLLEYKSDLRYDSSNLSLPFAYSSPLS